MPVPTNHRVKLAMEETLGTRYDTGGLAHHAVEVGGAIAHAIGVVDNCVNFLASAQRHLAIAHASDIEIDNDFSIVFGLKPNSLSTTMGILNKNNFGFVVVYQNSNRINVQWRGTNNAYSQTGILTTDWNHIACGIDHTNGFMWVQINDEDRITAPITVGYEEGAATSWELGRDNFGSYFDGGMDEWYYYPGTLTEGEVQEVFAIGTPEATLPELVLCYMGDSKWGTSYNPDPNVPAQIHENLKYRGISGAVREIVTLNHSVGGSASGSWIPGQANYENAKAALIAEPVAEGGRKYVLIFIGTNENNANPVTKAQYKANIELIILDLEDAGIQVFLCYSTWAPAEDTTVAPYRQIDYNEALSELAVEYPDTVIGVETTAYETIRVNRFLSDLVHPNLNGNRALTSAQSDMAYYALYPSEGGGGGGGSTLEGGYSGDYKAGDMIKLHLTMKNGENADALPTAELWRNGVQTAETVTVTLAETGDYLLSAAIPSSWAIGDAIRIKAWATQGGVTEYKNFDLGVLREEFLLDDETLELLEGINGILGNITPGSVTFVSPVLADGNATIVRGDDYKYSDGRAIGPFESGNWRDLTGAAVTMTVEGNDGTNILQKTGSVLNAGEEMQSVYGELTAAETEDLVGPQYILKFRATLANGNKTTLLTGLLTVNNDGA